VNLTLTLVTSIVTVLFTRVIRWNVPLPSSTCRVMYACWSRVTRCIYRVRQLTWRLNEKPHKKVRRPILGSYFKTRP